MSGLVHAHSGLRWLIVIGILVSLVMALVNLSSNKENKGLGTISKITFIVSHTQLLLGIGLWMSSGKVDFTQMKEALIRFYSAEHPLMMLLAVVAISLGYIKFKKSGFTKPKTIALFFGIATILLLAGIPWPFRSSLGAGWF